MGWIILFSSLIISSIVYALIYNFSEFTASAIYFLTMFLPLLYYSNWDYSILLHKPDRDEVLLAICMFVAYIFYAIIMYSLLDLLLPSVMGGVDGYSVSMQTMFSLIFAIMGEELIKFIPLMFFMRFFYKFSENRDISFILSSIIVMVGFGLLHYGNGLTIYSVLLIQGLGTIFELYGYYKTKNLLVPYMSHLLTDVFIIGLTFFPF